MCLHFIKYIMHNGKAIKDSFVFFWRFFLILCQGSEEDRLLRVAGLKIWGFYASFYRIYPYILGPKLIHVNPLGFCPSPRSIKNPWREWYCSAGLTAAGSRRGFRINNERGTACVFVYIFRA